jgi:tight adherence protein B
MTTMMITVAVFAGLTVFVLMLGVTRLITASSEVDDRLSTYANTVLLQAAAAQPGVGERVNTYLSERSFSGRIAIDLARAGAKLTVSEFLLIKLGAALVPAVGAWFSSRSVAVALLVGALCSLLPDLWLRREQRQRSTKFVLQLPDTLAMIVSGLKAGFSLQQSLINVGKEASEPTASEFNRVTQEIQLGVPMMEALDNLARRVKSEDLDMIISVFKIHTRVGGNLATVLETVGTTIRERVRLRREIEVITSMQRYSAYVLGLLPIVLGVILFVLNPDYMMEMFQWNIVLCIPIGAFVLTVMGFLVIRKMVDIKI